MINILLIGGTGVIGKSLLKILQRSGKYNIYLTTRNKSLTNEKNLTYFCGNSLDQLFILEVISRYKFSVIIDFMVYPTSLFEKLVSKFLNNCDHYIFLSSYRVYSNSGNKILTEKSLRLIDDIRIDKKYRDSEEYAIKKAKQENIIFLHKNKNWTILRPSITYGKNRIQLFCFEASLFLSRLQNKLPIVIPDNLENINTTLTDCDLSAKYIFELIKHPLSFSQVFNICSDFILPWDRLFQFYTKEFEAEFTKVSSKIFSSLHLNQYQVGYDRMLNRQLSNIKLKDTIGSTFHNENDFEKLKFYISTSQKYEYTGRINGRMDKLTVNKIKIDLISKNIDKLKYIIGFSWVLNSMYGLFNKNKYLK